MTAQNCSFSDAYLYVLWKIKLYTRIHYGWDTKVKLYFFRLVIELSRESFNSSMCVDALITHVIPIHVCFCTYIDIILLFFIQQIRCFRNNKTLLCVKIVYVRMYIRSISFRIISNINVGRVDKNNRSYVDEKSILDMIFFFVLNFCEKIFFRIFFIHFGRFVMTDIVAWFWFSLSSESAHIYFQK